MITMSLILMSLYAAVVGFMYGFQRHLMYFPSRDMREPSFYGLSGISEKTLLTDDHLEITSWYRAPKANEPILVYFHGNRGQRIFPHEGPDVPRESYPHTIHF